jgi:nicotinate-nucleotide--dimethylbenzimidazole phosphoribosyltransferase
MEYTEERLGMLIGGIAPPDGRAMEDARKRQAELAKPPGSLGRLEDLSVQLAGITGRVKNTLENRMLLVFCADNGVTEEGVSSAPQSVTAAQTVNLTRGKTGASSIAAALGCRVIVCDVGVNADLSAYPAVIGRKIAYSTKNIAKGPAMTRDEAIRAILTGADLAADTAEQGADVLGIGEMGIGNTTTSSAVLSVLTGTPVCDVTGRGGGITDAAYHKKISVIEEAIVRNRPDPEDPVDVLSKVGGFDLAAMTGAYLGAAKARVPAVMDGFISVVAALCAVRLCPVSAAFLIPSHASYEIGYGIAVNALRKKPLFDLGMRLGEGSGCPVAMMMLDAACAAMNGMATFPEARIDDGYLDPIRAADAFTVSGGTR